MGAFFFDQYVGYTCFLISQEEHRRELGKVYKGLFGDSRELKFGTSNLQQKPYASPTNKGEEHYLMKKEKVGRGCFEQESTGENEEFRVMIVSH